MILHLAGESIECDKCELIARKVVPSSPQEHDILGLVIKYDCTLNATAKNLKELNPKKFRCKLTSNLDLGATLKAKSIYFLTQSLKRLKFELDHESGAHKASKGIINYYVFAEIKYPLENIVNSIKKRKSLTL